MEEKRITLAAIAGAHGIGGEVRIKLFAESLDSFKQHKVFDAKGQALTLKSVRQTGKMPVARFEEVPDRNAAEALRHTELTVPRSALPPLDDGEYYHSDLIGLPCVSGQEAFGQVANVQNFGAGDVIEIEPAKGAVFMVPIKACTISNDKIEIDSNFAP